MPTVSLATQRPTDSISVRQQELTRRRRTGQWNSLPGRGLSSPVGQESKLSEADHIALPGVDSFTIVIAIETNFLQDYKKAWRGE